MWALSLLWAPETFWIPGVFLCPPTLYCEAALSLPPMLYPKATNAHKIGNKSRRIKSFWTTCCNEEYSYLLVLYYLLEYGYQVSDWPKPTAAGIVNKWSFKRQFKSRFLMIPPGKELISSTCEGVGQSLLSQCLNTIQTKQSVCFSFKEQNFVVSCRTTIHNSSQKETNISIFIFLFYTCISWVVSYYHST